MQRLVHDPRLLFAVSFVLGAGVVFFSGLYTDFHVAGNDFWAVLYYGRHMTWAEKASLYNGFFPIGYAFLIGQLPYAYVIQLSYVINALLAGLLTASVVSTVAAVRSIPAILFALIATLILPILFEYNNTVGPDVGVTAFSAFAVFLLWTDTLKSKTNSISLFQSILVGVSLGLAVLWRTHAIVLTLAILFCAFLILGIHPLRVRIAMVSSFLAIVMIQVLANLISGHGAWETAQNFNIYKLLYKVDWAYPPPPSAIAGFSLLQTLQDDPHRVLDAYLPSVGALAAYAWPGILCFLIAPKNRIGRFGLFAILVTLLYAIPIAFGDSPRAALGIVSLFITSLALAFVALTDRVKSWENFPKGAAVALTVGFLLVAAYPFYKWLQRDAAFLTDNRNQQRVFVSVEQVLLARGMTSPDQVYADKYKLYFPHTLPYLPRQIGGWSNGWVWGFDAEYPLISNDSWEVFKQACKQQGIQFLVISPQAGLQADFFPAIYSNEVDLGTLGLEFITRRANMMIYSLH